MEGRRPDWIRRRLGLSKAELQRQPRVLPRTLYPVHLGRSSTPHFADDSWVIAPGHTEGLLEEVSEPEDKETRKPKEQGIVARKIKAKILFVNVAYRYIL